MTWNDKDLKEKENKRKRKRGKHLEEREIHLNKGRECGKDIRGEDHSQKVSSSSSSFSSSISFSFFFIMQN